MTTAAPSTALVSIQPVFTDAERLALAGFLAGYRGLTREAYALDLRQFTTWCRARSLNLFAVRRADIESFARDLEARGRARATVTRRLCRLSGQSAREAAAAARRWMDRLGLADRAGTRIDRLSHGNQQRVQLAVALVHDPDLLVLDEPFAGLDPIAVDALAALMHELCRAGTTVLFSSHQLDLVEHLCEDVVILDKGRVVLAGRLSQLRAHAPRRRLEVMLARDAGQRWWERWSSALPGVEVVEGDSRRLRLTVDRAVDLEKVLAEARSTAEVVRFDFEPPSLSEIFREAVRS